MNKIIFRRLSRTPHSEQYQLFDQELRVAHVDLHYTAVNVFATLILDRELSEEDTVDLIQQIDDELVESSETLREDFFVRVFLGQELDEYSDVLRNPEDLEIDGHEPFELA